MRAKAVANKGKDLSRKSLDAGLHGAEVDFQLGLGDTHIIYGINLWRGIIHYLILPRSHENPLWIPAELFEVIDNRLPPEWFFRLRGFGAETGVNAIWGYLELALSDKHYVDLMNREGDAIPIFRKRQKEIERFDQQDGASTF